MLEELHAKVRRGRKPKQQPPAASSPMDADSEIDVPVVEHVNYTQSYEPPTKARRGRKPKPPPTPEMPTVDDDHAAAIVAELEGAEPPARLDRLDAEGSAAGPSAAHFDAATGSVSFDWTAIEQVAAQDGPNRALAKLLIAARAEGANSRWPF